MGAPLWWVVLLIEEAMSLSPPPPPTRRVWQQSSFGSLGKLKLERVPLPEMGDADVLVKVRAVGLNFADIFTVLGLYEAAVKAKQLPFVPGLEFSGVVEASNSSNFNIGDRVYGFRRFGAFTAAFEADHSCRDEKNFQFFLIFLFIFNFLVFWFSDFLIFFSS